MPSPIPSPLASRLATLPPVLRHPGVLFGLAVLLVVGFAALAAPFLWTGDPILLRPRLRLKPPSSTAWLGTDAYGRDVWSRVVYGARVSLAIGFSVATAAVLIGLVIGLVAGYLRRLDAVVMRIMDGLMAIPSILLAIAMVTLSGAGIGTVIVAIAIPEIPRVARLVRSVVLSVRSEPYVEAAIGAGTRLPMLLIRHVLPNTIAPLIVQGTYVCASAILTEAILSFLGAGIPTEIPSWGNIMAEGRQAFQIAPWVILFPGLCVAATVLAVNIIGDGLRDALDPRTARRVGALR
ncbi:ABC transporter permease [Methylobacterium sp. E-045]|uniref:ABC transporter permease n=1 Tax=Methylobacterium sp. E-045 TaxID=2836575 RepID=UPI001FB9028A|nr:ABC transporter permease [Methylobacterium sp. E-045]MCJ2128217.1 ABC transporter permease [Methylobacterium sp. E-045]